MNNTISINLRFAFRLVCILAGFALLQACGAERTTPFNPVVNCSSSSTSTSSSSSSTSTSSSDSSSSSSSSFTVIKCASSTSSSSSSSNTSSSSSSVSSVDAQKIWNGNLLTEKDKSTRIITTTDALTAASNEYLISGQTIADQNFDKGQVVLIDMGSNDGCAAYHVFDSVTVKTVDANNVDFTINYTQKAKEENCSPQINRPYYFYYVETKKLLLIKEVVK